MRVVYVVMFCEDYLGYMRDEKMCFFTEREWAEKRAHKLNEQLAKESKCRIKDLGDYYDVICVEEAM